MEKLTKVVRVLDDNLRISRRKVLTSTGKSLVISFLLIALYWLFIFVLDLKVTKSNNEALLEKLELSNKFMDSINAEIESIKYRDVIINLNYLSGVYLCQTESSMPNSESVRVIAEECNAWYPEVIVAQFKLESGSGTSNLAKKAHNLFGLVYTGKDAESTQSGEYNGFRSYKNWQLCVIDRVKLDYRYFKSKPSKSEYLRVMGSRYAEDENYLAKLNNLIDD